MPHRTTPAHRSEVALAAVLLAALTAASAGAAPRGGAFPWFAPEDVRTPVEVQVTTPDGESRTVRRCGAPAGPAKARAEVDAALDLWRSLGKLHRRAEKTTIPVAVHVVRGDGEVGEVSDRQIADQIRVLDRAFRRSAFRFDLASVDRTERRKWHRKCRPFDERGRLRATYRKMTSRLSVDAATTLDLYTCDLLREDLLGTAMLPWFFLGESPLDAVVVDYRTLPGGGAAPYDEGDTVVHEVGHWLGLHHTFQDGCSAPGDDVADTPFEAVPAIGCPVGRDSCADDPGLDPVTNFMDSGDDACAARFSKGQRRRARIAVDLYRPGIGGPAGGEAVKPPTPSSRSRTPGSRTPPAPVRSPTP